jgi:hypothetical protein
VAGASNFLQFRRRSRRSGGRFPSPRFVPSGVCRIFNRTGAEMNRMGDETMALTVAEVTMQDFLAAVMLAERSPAPVPVPRWQPSQPLIEYPVVRCTARRSTPFTPTPVARRRSVSTTSTPQHETPARLAGARVGYWLGLATAVTAVVFL